jgi:hypothetical protein
MFSDMAISSQCLSVAVGFMFEEETRAKFQASKHA